MKPVIICGGVGTKMWPMSSPEMPKHFLPLIGEKSLFQLTWEMLRKQYKAEEIYLQTNAYQAGLAQKQVAEIVAQNIFIEPDHRDQGPATGFMAAKLFKIDPEEPFFLVQADVLRIPSDNYLGVMKKTEELIKRTGKLVTGVIKPKFLVRGVDYIKVKSQKAESLKEFGKVYEVEKWIMREEEGDLQEYFDKGELYLHANHYAWTPRAMLEAFKRRAPEWYGPLEAIIGGADEATEYAKMPKAGIEYMVTKFEAENTLVVEADYDWVDFGTWESVDKYLSQKSESLKVESSELEKQNKIEIEAKNNFVKSDYSAKPVAIVGLDNIVVIDSPKGLLVCPKDKTGKVGEVVKMLSKK